MQFTKHASELELIYSKADFLMATLFKKDWNATKMNEMKKQVSLLSLYSKLKTNC